MADDTTRRARRDPPETTSPPAVAAAPRLRLVEFEREVPAALRRAFRAYLRDQPTGVLTADDWRVLLDRFRSRPIPRT